MFVLFSSVYIHFSFSSIFSISFFRFLISLKCSYFGYCTFIFVNSHETIERCALFSFGGRFSFCVDTNKWPQNENIVKRGFDAHFAQNPKRLDDHKLMDLSHHGFRSHRNIDWFMATVSINCCCFFFVFDFSFSSDQLLWMREKMYKLRFPLHSIEYNHSEAELWKRKLHSTNCNATNNKHLFTAFVEFPDLSNTKTWKSHFCCGFIWTFQCKRKHFKHLLYTLIDLSIEQTFWIFIQQTVLSNCTWNGASFRTFG